ncbi:MAG: D-glycero-beta-D-manno-heptose-1,7-bisphosphate 7-phosphatase [Legionellales bacterium]|nr:D-glycero-beta-D-manno-heptose-1,7-bisphosphate 7-phosphatase [Legionellales bacterium]|tara:strand:- start:114306 stop:114839 length:534 start_codon:yes stop_codon:yes gene_type:complete
MKLVILDRDGVINEDSDAYIKSPDEWHIIPGSAAAILTLNTAGYIVVVATNQSGIGRGFYDEDMLDRIHLKMTQALNHVGAHLDGIFVCPHHPDDDCDCRKPKPGLLHQIAERFNVDLHEAILIGDSLRDLQAIAAVGGQGILVRTGKGEKTLTELNDQSIPVYENLAAAVGELINA